MTEKSKAATQAASAAGAAGIVTGLALNYGLDAESFIQFLSHTAQSQIAQAGFFFTLAAWLHSGRVKKEIGKNFVALTDAINNVAQTLRRDLDTHKKILENHGLRIQTLEEPKNKINQGEANA